MSSHTLLVLFFVANTALLCGFSIFYSLDCIHIQEKCHQGAIYTSTIFGIAAVFYGITCLISLFYYGRFHYLNKGPKCFVNFMMTLSATAFVFALVVVVCLLISLFFDFDPAALDDKYRKAHFVLMWVLAGYSVGSNGLLLLFILYISYKQSDLNPDFKTPEIYTTSTEKEQKDIPKIPIV